MINYCKECGEERGYKVTSEVPKSFGQCDICGEITECYAMPKEKCVKNLDEEAVLKVMKAINHLHALGFETIKDTKTGVTLTDGRVIIGITITQEETTHVK